MQKIFNIADKSVQQYWKNNNLIEQDFYCKECGKILIDKKSLENLIYRTKTQIGKTIDKPHIFNTKTKKRFIENENDRWCIIGRNLSGKLFFRKICWDCFFVKLRKTEDIARKARKSKWYAKILNGENIIPISSVSPSPYFKLLFDITDEELEYERSKFDTASLSSFIRRHGEKLGKEKYKEYRNRQAYTCSKEYMKETRGWTKEQWDEYNSNRAVTKKNFIDRYGKEIGSNKWKQYKNVQSYVGCTLEYFIDTYGEKEGKLKYLEVNAKKAMSLDNFIARYGEGEGFNRFKKLKNKGYSDISLELFKNIDKKLQSFAKYSRYSLKGGEQVINLFFEDGTCKACRPDYILNNKIIEFNGDFWHANPEIYNESDIIVTYAKKYIVRNIWEEDRKRKEALEKLGYKVKIIWEKDYRENKEKIIDECCEFLKS